MSFLSAWKPIPTKLDSFVFELLRQNDAPDSLLSTDEPILLENGSSNRYALAIQGITMSGVFPNI